MKVVFVGSGDHLIAYHTPDTAPALAAYEPNGALERHVVEDAAVVQIGVRLPPTDPEDPFEVPMFRPEAALAKNWRGLIVEQAEKADA